MSEARFTRTQWKYNSNDGSITDNTLADNEIAIVNTDWQTLGTGDANAHLIAAAPEMYELLQRWADSVDCIPDNYQDAIQQETIELLAKARGETA